MRLSELVTRYLEFTILRPKTATNYQAVMRTFIAKVGDIPVSNITVDISVAFRDEVLSRAKPVTFNNYRLHLSVLFNFAVDNGWMQSNPFGKTKAIRVHKKPKKTVDQNLIEKVFIVLDTEAKLAESNYRKGRFHPQWFWRLVVETFFFTGMRLRQLVELKWEDVDFDQRAITLTAEGSKSHREWVIPLPDILVMSFQDMFAQTCALLGKKVIHERQVFCLPLFSRYKNQFSHEKMIDDNVSAFFKRLSGILGEKVSPHRLRHTFATILVNTNQNDLKSIQQMLGHTDVRMTMEYIEVNLDDMRRMVNSLSYK